MEDGDVGLGSDGDQFRQGTHIIFMIMFSIALNLAWNIQIIVLQIVWIVFDIVDL